jgi:hypothetical protein
MSVHTEEERFDILSNKLDLVEQQLNELKELVQLAVKDKGTMSPVLLSKLASREWDGPMADEPVDSDRRHRQRVDLALW